jgi:hypothetical protein
MGGPPDRYNGIPGEPVGVKLRQLGANRRALVTMKSVTQTLPNRLVSMELTLWVAQQPLDMLWHQRNSNVKKTGIGIWNVEPARGELGTHGAHPHLADGDGSVRGEAMKPRVGMEREVGEDPLLKRRRTEGDANIINITSTIIGIVIIKGRIAINGFKTYTTKLLRTIQGYRVKRGKERLVLRKKEPMNLLTKGLRTRPDKSTVTGTDWRRVRAIRIGNITGIINRGTLGGTFKTTNKTHIHIRYMFKTTALKNEGSRIDVGVSRMKIDFPNGRFQTNHGRKTGPNRLKRRRAYRKGIISINGHGGLRKRESLLQTKF